MKSLNEAYEPSYSTVGRIQKRLLNFTRNTSGCWVWQGLKTDYGYGRTEWNRVNTRTHRVIYQLIYGKLRRDQVLDHLCRNTSCVNPRHLEVVTDAINLARGNGVGAINARKTECILGHKLSVDNTYITKGGGRQCLTCHRFRQRRYYKARQALKEEQ